MPRPVFFLEEKPSHVDMHWACFTFLSKWNQKLGEAKQEVPSSAAISKKVKLQFKKLGY